MMKYNSRLPGDVWREVKHCSIDENHMSFCGHADHKWYYEAKMNYINMLVMLDDEV